MRMTQFEAWQVAYLDRDVSVIVAACSLQFVVLRADPVPPLESLIPLPGLLAVSRNELTFRRTLAM